MEKSNADDSFTGGSSESVVDLKAPKGSIAKTKTSELKSILKSIVNSNDITPPNETTKLVHFPTPSDYLMTPQQRPSMTLILLAVTFPSSSSCVEEEIQDLCKFNLCLPRTVSGHLAPLAPVTHFKVMCPNRLTLPP